MKKVSNTQMTLTMAAAVAFGMFGIPALEEHYHVADKVSEVIHSSLGIKPVLEASAKAPAPSQ